jgi:hypothetical protein
LLVAALSTAAAAQAQTAPKSSLDRKGFYGDIGMTYSMPSMELTDGTETAKNTTGGIGFTIGLGTGLNDHWRVGAQFDWFNASEAYSNDLGPGIDANMKFYTAAVTFYPQADNFFWIRANLGYGTESLTGGTSTSGSGFAAGLGFGYDWKVGQNGFVIGPYLEFMNLFKTSAFGGDFEGSNVTGTAGVFQIGAVVGYRH